MTQNLAIYEVRNKVFRVLFWNKEEAEEFVSQYSPTTGLEMLPVEVWGSFRKRVEDSLSEEFDRVAKEKSGEVARPSEGGDASGDTAGT